MIISLFTHIKILDRGYVDFSTNISPKLIK